MSFALGVDAIIVFETKKLQIQPYMLFVVHTSVLASKLVNLPLFCGVAPPNP